MPGPRLAIALAWARSPSARLARRATRLRSARQRTRALAPFALALAMAGGLVRAQDAASRQSLREWNQPRGCADLSSCVDVEPIVRAPLEAWRLAFKELDCEPVSWGGVVFVAGVQQRDALLYAFELSSGKSAAVPARLGGARPRWLAAWQGFVALVQSDGVQILSLRGGQFASTRKFVKVANPGPPSVLAGQLFTCDAAHHVHCIDLDQGQELGRFEGGVGQPALLALDEHGRALVGTIGVGRPQHPDPNQQYVGQFLSLDLCEIQGLGTPAPRFSSRPTRFHGSFARPIESEDLLDSFPIALPPAGPEHEPRWLAFSRELIESRGEPMHLALFPKSLVAIASPPTVADGEAVGFTSKGELVRVHADGELSAFPLSGGGAQAQRRHGIVTRARGVLYLENWALRLEDAHVLWELPELAPEHGLCPAGDGRALYTSAKHELVCLCDPLAQPAAASNARESSARPARPSAPGSGTGVVLADGSRLPGAVTRAADGGVDLAPERGAPRHLARTELALIEDGARVERVGSELAVYRAAFAAASFEHREALGGCLETCLAANLVDHARRLAGELRDFGAASAELAALDRRLSGRVQATDRNAASASEGERKQEQRVRERSARRFAELAQWCRAQALRSAASVLFDDARRAWPGWTGVETELGPLVPAGAWWRGEPDAATRWSALARELLPSGAELVAPEDPAWKRLAQEPWSSRTLLVRSANLELASREDDPRVIGSALRLGERAVEVLGPLLGPVHGSAARLDVRLHASAEDYRAENERETGARGEWMAGHYSPRENVSRFFVPRSRSGLELREMERVLVHELVHHYVAARWMGATSRAALAPDEPGFWVVEGFAEFVGGQVLEMDRRGARFDDPQVLAVDATAELAAGRNLIPLAELIDLDQRGFWKLSDQPLADVQLRYTLKELELTQRTIFYQQSAALVFFLLNRAGAEHARQLIEYLRDWHAGRLTAQSWTALGYGEIQDLARPFAAFLEERRRR